MTRHPAHMTAALPVHNTVRLLNSILIAMSVAALLFYIVTANQLAAHAWRTADAQDQLRSLVESRNGLVAQQSTFEDRARLTALAVDAGFVPAGAVAYLVQERAVAAR